MKIQIGNLFSIYNLAINEEDSIREKLEQIQIEMSELPYLVQRVELSKKIDALRQELHNAVIKRENFMKEIDFTKNRANKILSAITI